MSIIHEALKKVQITPPTPNDSPQKRGGKIILLLLLIILTALSSGYLYWQARLPDGQARPPKQIIALTPAAPTPKQNPPPAPKPEDPHAFNIQGTMSDQRGNVAIINGKIYTEGDMADGAKIVKINMDSIVVSRDGQEETIAVKR